MGLLERLPFWFWTLGVIVVASIILRSAHVSDTGFGGFMYDLTVQNIVPYIVVALPFVAALFAVVGVVHLIHDHQKSIGLFISAGLLGGIALLWHWGIGAWIMANWLVRPA